MTDPVTNVEIEDVLTSIRRLVSEETRKTLAPTSVATPAVPDKLVLTPALRVMDVDTAPAEPDVEKDGAPQDAAPDDVLVADDVAKAPAADTELDVAKADSSELADHGDDDEAADGAITAWGPARSLRVERAKTVEEDATELAEMAIDPTAPDEPAAVSCDDGTDTTAEPDTAAAVPDVLILPDLTARPRDEDIAELAPEPSADDDLSASLAPDIEAEEAQVGDQTDDVDPQDTVQPQDVSVQTETPALADADFEDDEPQDHAPVILHPSLPDPLAEEDEDVVAADMDADVEAPVSVWTPPLCPSEHAATLAPAEEILVTTSDDEAVSALPDTDSALHDLAAQDALEDDIAPDQSDDDLTDDETPDWADALTQASGEAGWAAPDPELDSAISPASSTPTAEMMSDTPVAPSEDTEIPADAAAAIDTLTAKIAMLEAQIASARSVSTSDEDKDEDDAPANVTSVQWPTSDMADVSDEEAEAEAAAALREAQEANADIFNTEETVLDEETLRELVTDIVREELQGALGERITRNVRKLVRREIHRALVAQELD